ncbi:MAG TPA: lipid-binding SYLF domain-containing protein [Chthoniobacterales bacterium]|nr:lipid-binding SYLF domain-containing protein [Chthoniobacterales bacterium]
MVRKIALTLLCVAGAAFSQKKEEERIVNATSVLKETLNRDLSPAIVSKSLCIAVFPSVKKVAIGIGSSYGRGVLVCRQNEQSTGAWRAPIMFELEQGSVGLQLGSSATDFVLTVMTKEAAEKFLSGRAKLGTDAAVAAGPAGSQASAYSPEAQVLTYSRTKGVFAGVSLSGAGVDVDKDANKAVYGKEISATEILNSDTVPPAGKELVDLLNRVAPGRPRG